MIQIALEAIPNQSFSLSAGGFRHSITVKEANGMMAITIETDDQSIIQGQKITASSEIIPYRYLERGNFTMLTLNDEIPYYDKFGVSQFLYYLTPEELVASRD